MTDPAWLTLREAAAAVRDRRLSSRELTEAVLARARRLNPRLNAVISFDDEDALAAADRADATAPSGPLHGVPLAHKDMFHRAGKVVTCGSALRRGFRPPDAAHVLDRLAGAGAFPWGALHMVEFAFGVTGHNAAFGPARNPHDPSRITGGSSSGSGAAVAAGLSFASLGSDTGGSVRLPSHFCGVTGLKTSFGLVSRAGAMPLSASLDTIGALARDAADLRLLLPLIAGADPRDPATGAPWRKDARAAKEMTIGVADAFYVEDLHPAVARACDAAIETFRALGVRVRTVRLPDQRAFSAAAVTILGSEAAALHRNGLRDHADLYGPQTRARLLNGFAYPAALYVDALRARGPGLAAQIEAMDACDAILAPTAPFPAPAIAETDVATGAEALIADVSRFMRPVNYLGLPALALPAGASDAGLPVGVQLMGRPGRDDALLTLGEAFQAATDHHLRRPRDPT
ncbi:amidase [Methylopila jiangsuensis]|uniref:Indoleacetamide hydrolase n=1 Tax=Methylopila jiangsuensis TaxID=586230 RepID=A0A9W6JGD5_9HYPH|nr:amidase [Methylopila jiangsuensis]MDR6285501.1 aspartyl-tRNA(Asn)/glutamyl-tRNA(Gln) amidotransferase subunit A [Methylopila jiangsuensis]GLK75259.1 amidase [Methylopila jiangsuensis]